MKINSKSLNNIWRVVRYCKSFFNETIINFWYPFALNLFVCFLPKYGFDQSADTKISKKSLVYWSTCTKVLSKKVTLPSGTLQRRSKENSCGTLTPLKVFHFKFTQLFPEHKTFCLVIQIKKIKISTKFIEVINWKGFTSLWNSWWIERILWVFVIKQLSSSHRAA